MEFALTEEQTLVQDTARRMVERDIQPILDANDPNKSLPKQDLLRIYSVLAEQGLMAPRIAAEGTGDTMSLITWVVFGAAVVGREVEFLSWQVVVYAVLSLTVIRMLPIYLSLAGSGLRSDAKLFVGWFGPRGLASVVFAVIVLNEQLPGGNTVVATATCAIILSVVLHGVSANPLIAALYGKKGRAEETVSPDEPH